MSIVVNQLTKTYGSQKAIDNLSFEVKTGEIVGFLGPNGAGKSTTMKIITCYMAANAGNVEVGGVSIADNPDEVKKKIGYLPENNPLYLDMYVIDYITFVAHIQGVAKSTIPGKIREVIALCGLDKEKHKKIGELSKGYRQRVGLAQAMIHDPEVLILDEATTGLDPNQIVEIRNLIRKLGKEKTVLLSSHILSEVEATCDRIVIVNNGKIVADGTSDMLRHRGKAQELLIVQVEAPASADVFKALLGLPTIESVNPKEEGKNLFEVQSKPEESSRKAIFDLCVKKKWYLTELTGTETSLEDVFRELTN